MAAFLYSYLAHEPTIGFHMKEFTWYQYLFTQCRVLFIYLRLFLLPFGQTADYAIELSHTPLEHGAIFGMIALSAATVAAIVWRKRFPIASYGFFVTPHLLPSDFVDHAHPGPRSGTPSVLADDRFAADRFRVSGTGALERTESGGSAGWHRGDRRCTDVESQPGVEPVR